MKERLLRAGRIGLAVAAITSGLTADACAKKPPVPSSPAGITGKAPQFSNTDGDRPLQDQEKPVEQSWTNYISPDLPFQVDYPSSWRVSTDIYPTTISIIRFFIPLNNDIGKGAETFYLETNRQATVEEWVKTHEDFYETKAVKVALKTRGRSEQTAWKISSNFSHMYIFSHKNTTWSISFLTRYVPENVEEKIMQSFTLLDTVNRKAVDNTNSPPKTEQGPFSKKPKDLFKALLTTPMRPDELALEITPGEQAAEELDGTEQALGAVGKVIIAISKIDKQQGFIDEGTISYTVFPDAQKAKDAYDVLLTAARKKSGIPISNFSGYSTMIETGSIPSEFASQYQAVIVDRNVVIVVKFGNIIDNKENLNEIAYTGMKAVRHLVAIAEK